nr:MAG TPA: hypothetical protein [Caudoviricetes sp.]
MSDLNLDNIVGFKAVDKDGNEQNVTVDEMVDMVSTRMVMALSETSTFAAVAATGNDVYENELPTVTDAANVRVLQSSGDAAQMTMQSLASKLGGLLPLVSENNNGLAWKGGFIERVKITSSMSIDDYTNPGMYGLDGCQDSPYKYGGLIVFKANVLVVQIVYGMQGSNRPKYRQNWANQGWQSWYSF